MKKGNKLFALLLVGTLLVGCGKEKNTTVSASISEGKTTVATANKEKTQTLSDLYKTLYSDATVMDQMFRTIAETELLKDMTKEELAALVDERRQELLEENLNSDSYKDSSLTNGVVSLFNEKLLVRALRQKGYNIPCENNVYGPEINDDYSYTEGKIFKCDYSEYFEKEIDNDIYKNLLVEKYLRVEKSSLLDKNKTVKVKYIAIPSADYSYITETVYSYNKITDNSEAVGDYVLVDGSYVEITDANQSTYIGVGTYEFFKKVVSAEPKEQTARTKLFMQDAVKDLMAGETLEDIETKWEAVKKDVEQFKYNKACPFNDSYLNTSSHGNVEKECAAYTNSGAYSDAIGLKVALRNITETEYVHEEIIDSSATILNTDIVASLFAENVSDKLHSLVEGSTTKYLAITTGNNFSANDVIISDSTNNYYYIIQVELIDSKLDDENAAAKALKDEAIKKLAESDASIISSAIEFYLAKYDIKVHDEAFYNYLDSSFPKVEFDY